MNSPSLTVPEASVGSRPLTYADSMIQMLFSPTEYNDFCGIIAQTASEYPEICGVLVTGSLAQQMRLPTLPDIVTKDGVQTAYEDIVCRSRRKLFPHIDADLDIWLAIDDVPGAEKYRATVEGKAYELVKWYAAQKVGGPDQEKKKLGRWIAHKRAAFTPYYHRPEWYPRTWTAHNERVQHAAGFRDRLIDRFTRYLPSPRSRIMTSFRKHYPDFIEVRATPVSFFNLRPEKIHLSNGEVDRTPFAYYLPDWVAHDRNSLVVYTRDDDASDLIYPFNPSGEILGRSFAKRIGWQPSHLNYQLFRDRKDLPRYF